MRRVYQEDFNVGSPEDVKNIWSGLRPLSPDDFPIVGTMAYYPNIVINAGHGGNGLVYAVACGKILQELIEGSE